MEFQDVISEINTTLANAYPDKCEGCAVQCDMRGELGALLVQKTVYNHMAAEMLIGEGVAQVDELIDAVFPADQADQAKISIRQMTASELDSLDENIQKVQDKIDANARSCSGPLKMRATKGGVTYVTSICTSANVYVRGVRRHLPAHITAEL